MTELQRCGASRTSGRQPGANPLVHDQLERRAELLIQIAIDAVAVHEVAPETARREVKDMVTLDVTPRARVAIASAMRFHCAVSSPS